jgi:hypothetical protein
MAAPRGALSILLLCLAALAVPQGATAQAATGGLGEARGCTRSRIGVTGTVAPVTAASHTFLGRFVGSFSRYVQPNLRDVRGEIQIGVGGPAPTAVAFAMKRPVAQPLLPEQKEDRLAPEQHRALFTGIESALAEIGGTPDASFTVTLRVEGRC